ncbi:hypothetical protein ACFV1L_32800 [Kitasatospora sp. NPDC059646]|uniref:hypothetical protein n=1 Tax=Kitasatospora sp. NPDC059646 TaxID=3346893 RepID=UPI0036B356C5
MTERFGTRQGWKLLWVAAVLAALVHSLLCVHAPLSAAAPTDSLPAAARCPAAAGPQHGAPHDGGRHDDSPQDGERHGTRCADEDQPVTVHQGDRPLPAPAGLLLAEPAAPAVPARPAGLGCGPGASRPDGGRTRAVLGVWRT